ncbi:MAG: helix-turn-helix transcriptional regulator [Treponema sp.]
MMSEHTFAMLQQIARGIAVHFGSNCEVLVHDLSADYAQSSIVIIENGAVSMRKIGDGPSHVVLEALHSNHKNLEDKLSYLTKTKDGRILKSSTMFIRGENGTVEAVLAINFDITSLQMAENVMQQIVSPLSTKNEPENIPQNVNDLLDELIEQSVHRAGKPVALMNKDDKIAAIKFLNQSGAFLITKSGDKISNYFGISKYTLYSYIDAGEHADT